MDFRHVIFRWNFNLS